MRGLRMCSFSAVFNAAEALIAIWLSLKCTKPYMVKWTVFEE
jgi:hypothetical protein